MKNRRDISIVYTRHRQYCTDILLSRQRITKTYYSLFVIYTYTWTDSSTSRIPYCIVVHARIRELQRNRLYQRSSTPDTRRPRLFAPDILLEHVPGLRSVSAN